MTTFARREWLFLALVAAFCAIFLLKYPASFAIADESEILSLAYSIAHGTVYPDRAGLLTWNPLMELAVGGHRIVKYSPFHALLLAPAVASDWRLAFLVSAAFFIVGAFAVRAMLREAGLALAAGAAPAMIALAAYNYATTASALRRGYAINGEAFWFSGEHFASFFPFYVASLAIFPVATVNVNVSNDD